MRYWDSRRDWRGKEDLKLLLGASDEAVRLLRPARSPSQLKCIAEALTRRANGCFKAACVETDWAQWLDLADAATGEVRTLLQHCPPSSVLGRALLVAGVSMSVRAHRLRQNSNPYRRIVARAAQLFLEAERILQLSVGPINENSLYTHGNLGELLLVDVGDLCTGLSHFFRACSVGVAFFGSQHPNVKEKLNEFAQVLREIDNQLTNKFADLVEQGNLSFEEEFTAWLFVCAERWRANESLPFFFPFTKPLASPDSNYEFEAWIAKEDF